MAYNKTTGPAVSIGINPAEASTPDIPLVDDATWQECVICGGRILPTEKGFYAKTAKDSYHTRCLDNDGIPPEPQEPK